MQLRYDEELVEAAVLLCANGDREGVQPFASGEAKGCTPHPLQIRRFHREREKPYGILDPDERNAAFFTLHLDWFREWGLEQVLLNLVDEFPLLRKSLTVLAFRKARGRNEEGAELFVSAETGRNAVVALLPERFAKDEKLVPFLRHEFMHLNDMLDPAFGYSPQLHSAGHNPAQQRLTRERYRLLWDISIDGRLVKANVAADVRRRNPSPIPSAAPPPHVGGSGALGDQHRAAFDRVFAFWSEDRRDEIFGSLWNGTEPRHGDLLAIASDPREVKLAHEPLPGALCPLCDFATFQWAPAARLDKPVVEAIHREFPHWSPEHGVCARCAEVYAVNLRSNLALA